MPSDFDESFKKGLVELLYLDPNIGALARGMGKPVIDNSISTASLKWDRAEKKIVFAANQEFIEDEGEEMVASIILHETQHLIFEHIQERLDGGFPNKEVLHLAQECINNDIIADIYQLPLPDDAVTGRDLINMNCASKSTRQVYDILMEQLPPQEGGNNPSPNPQGKSEGGSGNQNQKSKPQPNDDDNNDDEEDGDGDGDGDGENNPEENKDNHSGHGCGGIDINDDDILDLQDYLENLVKDAARENGKSVKEFMDEIDNTKSGGFSPTGASLANMSAMSSTRMNWNYLLAKINPKVLEAGKKTKVKYDWTKQNRRLISVFPTAIIPKVKTHDPQPSDKGDSLPVLVIALDLSGSIPRSLVKMLEGLLQDIPEKLIKAYPCTWADVVIPYEPGGYTANGGTNFHNVINYVKEIQEETQTDPYVLVITDGEFWITNERPGKDWYFMAVDDKSFAGQCRLHIKDEDHLYHVKDFKA